MSLRARILQGGLYMSLREGLGMVISLGGMLLLTRTIGPSAFGVYAAALGFYNYLLNVSQWGLGVYLTRKEGDLADAECHQAFTLLLLLGSCGALLGLAGLPLLVRVGAMEGLGPVAAALFAGLPPALLAAVPLARLERALDYRRVARVELLTQVAFYAVALPLAFGGAGAWAPVGGWWAQTVVGFGALYGLTGYRPRLCWDAGRAREMIRYGLGYSASMWVWQMRSLVSPLIVGPLAGAAAVGYIALAVRIVETLSFVRMATWRISMAAFGRFQGDRARLVRALSEGARLQVLALGPLLVGFALVGAPLLPLLFGPKWEPALRVFPYIGLGYLVNVMFSLHSSALYVLRRNWEVTQFHLVHVALFFGGAAVLVPRYGMLGYGWAEMVAVAGYAVIHRFAVRFIGSPEYAVAALWGGACALGLFYGRLGWPALLGPVAALLWPETWKILREYAQAGLRGSQHV